MPNKINAPFDAEFKPITDNLSSFEWRRPSQTQDSLELPSGELLATVVLSSVTWSKNSPADLVVSSRQKGLSLQTEEAVTGGFWDLHHTIRADRAVLTPALAGRPNLRREVTIADFSRNLLDEAKNPVTRYVNGKHEPQTVQLGGLAAFGRAEGQVEAYGFVSKRLLLAACSLLHLIEEKDRNRLSYDQATREYLEELTVVINARQSKEARRTFMSRIAFHAIASKLDGQGLLAQNPERPLALEAVAA
ncbi:MAG TPA: hypothetical protein VLG27_00035 [Candidatus Saccharimonadia bacterium]|nr:hypothetical protein [Candidatus Saccharimonadia bacterium]